MSFDEWVCFGIPEEIIQQASSWIAELDAGNISASRQAVFLHWLDENPQNRWAFEELSEAWAKTSVLTDIETQIETPQVVPFSRQSVLSNTNPTSIQTNKDWLHFGAIALIIIGLIFANI
jgi:ferric-dicitrate binding protein FerR (iron transport regulator)